MRNHLDRIIILLLALVFLAAGAGAAGAENAVRVDYAFAEPAVTPGESGTIVTIDGGVPESRTGFPMVPVRIARVLLPPGTGVGGVTVSHGPFTALPGRHELPVAQEVLPLGRFPDWEIPPRLEFHGAHPTEIFRVSGVQRLRGHQVLLLELYPVRYDSRTGTVSWTAEIGVTVNLSADRAPLAAGGRRVLEARPGDPGDRALVAGFVDNPGDLPAPPDARAPLAADYRYLIVTTEALRPAFAPLLEHRRARGLTGRLVTMEELEDPAGELFWLANDPPPPDRAARLRNLIRAAWLDWGTRYVLLGGDHGHVPVRYFYNPHPGGLGGPIPSDMYYSNLDGDFDFNGNGIYGEPGDGTDGGEVDLLADIALGRVPASTPGEAGHFVAKTISFDLDGTAALRRAAMVGEKLDDVPTWGGDAKDAIAGLIPPDWEVTRHYQRDRTHNRHLIAARFKEGVQLVNNLAHGSTGYSFGFTSGRDILGLDNTRFPLVYSQGCQEGAFDLQDNSIGEYFVTAPRGAAAFIGNSRYGWYSPGNVLQGPSQVFDREFFSVLFEENVTALGAAFHGHKDNLAALVPVAWPYRFVAYELNLFGDPALEIIRAPATPAPAELEGRLYFLRDGEIMSHDFSSGATRPVTALQAVPGAGAVGPISLSADGRHFVFAFTVAGTTDLFRVNSDGSGLENLSVSLNLRNATVDPHSAALSPRGDLLAFAAENRQGLDGGRQLWLKELTGARRLAQLTFLEGDVSHPIFLYGGRILFHFADRFSTREDYYQVFTTGTGLASLTGHTAQAPDFPSLGRPGHGAVQPDRVVYGRRDQLPIDRRDWVLYTRGLLPGAAAHPVLEALYHSVPPVDQPDPEPVLVAENLLVFSGEHPESGRRQFFLSVFNAGNPYLEALPGTENASSPVYHRPVPRFTRLAWTGTDNRLHQRGPDGGETTLTDAPNYPARDPSFAPDGSRVAYAGGAGGIRVVGIDGTGEVVPDSTFDARYPAFSPCGDWLAYVRRPAGGSPGDADIFAAATDGSRAPVRLTFTPAATKADPAFSPCGGFLLYTHAGGLRLFPVTIGPDGPVLSPAEAWGLPPGNRQGAFSPDGDTVYFISTRGDRPEIYRMNAAGASSQRPVEIFPRPAAPSWPRPAPDPADPRLLFLDQGQAFLADRSTSAGAPLAPTLAVLSGPQSGRADWAVSEPARVSVERRFIFNRADPAIPFPYFLDVSVDSARPAGALLLTENPPSEPAAAVDWTLDGATINGYDAPPASVEPGAARWLLNEDQPGFTGFRARLTLSLDLAGDGPPGDERFFFGSVTAGQETFQSRGDYRIELGYPNIPVDLDRDWRISDEELLFAIGHWAAGRRISGWPLELSDWNARLLQVIDFWISPGGYEYDPAASAADGFPRWRTP